MNKFSDFGIESEAQGFVGDKIKMAKLLNKEITIHSFIVEPSKYEKGDGKRLTMQISIDGNKRVVWTSSLVLREMIRKVPESKFPFVTKIEEEENGRLKFT